LDGTLVQTHIIYITLDIKSHTKKFKKLKNLFVVSAREVWGKPLQVDPMPVHVRVRALYDYEGQAALSELTFNAGDEMVIHSKYHNGWWDGEFNGVHGWVIGEYFEEI